jgi:HNH endonuclease
VPQCMVCETEITAENDSDEHLIPEAIGGRRKIRSFICRTCNAAAGETWDAEIARQLLPLSLMLDISRERGDPPPLKVTSTADERLTIGPGEHSPQLTPSSSPRRSPEAVRNIV